MALFAVSTAVLKEEYAVLKEAYFESTSAFSAAVVFPSAIAVLIELSRFVMAVFKAV